MAVVVLDYFEMALVDDASLAGVFAAEPVAARDTLVEVCMSGKMKAHVGTDTVVGTVMEAVVAALTAL